MPRLESKIEGRGNGIKTVVTNMVTVAEALNRPPSLPIKFFGTELGAQSRWEEEVRPQLFVQRAATPCTRRPCVLQSEKATVNGAHQTGDLQR